jgi:exosortase family protein XrtF
MEIIRKNKPFFLFLLKFGVGYLVLSLAYWLYLSQFDAAKYEADGITRIVAYQTRDVVALLGEDAYTRPRHHENSFRFYVNGKSVARIVEGCNAVSVMILFTSFIIAFSSTLKRTLLYTLSGLVIIYALNVLRVALLCMSFYYYPQYNDIVHDIVFPLFIYGVVFLLWILWITKFSGHAKRVSA